MKPMIALTGLLIAAAAPTLAAETLTGGRPALSEKKQLDQAFESCAHSFLSQLFPGQEVTTRPTLTTPYQKHVSTAERVWKKTEFTIIAEAKRGRSQLAVGTCVVGRDARVETLLVRNASTARFAGLTARDVNLMVASR